MLAEAVGQQGHDGEQTEQAGRGARDCPVRPLPLGLDAQVVAHLAEGDFELPSLDEPADDLQRLLRQVGAEQGLRVEVPAGVAQQHPADRHDRQATVLAITDKPDAPAGKFADHVLVAKSGMVSVVDSLVAAMSVINALVVSIGRSQERLLTQTFENLEHIWDEYDVYERVQ